jgi:hypothetical protein
MGLILRRNLDRPLTHEELDGNLIYLDINEWKLQSYEKGMWVYEKNSNDITALYICTVTHNQNIYPSSHFIEVVNGVRIWSPFRGLASTGTTFQGFDPTTATNFEGIPAGSTFPIPTSMQDMWTMLLYPYQLPVFTQFIFIDNNGTLEIGQSFTGDTASWGTSNSGNVAVDSVNISGFNLTTITGLSSNGTTPLIFSSPVTRTLAGSEYWYINGTDTHSNAMSQLSFYIRWDWMFYWGTSTNTILNESEIEALSSKNLQSAIAGTYSFSENGYKYFCYANGYGNPVSFYDSDTGFQVAMYEGYSNASVGGSSFELIPVTNVYGQTTDYRIYRTKNILGGAINMRIN